MSVFDRGFLTADRVYEVTSVLGSRMMDFADLTPDDMPNAILVNEVRRIDQSAHWRPEQDASAVCGKRFFCRASMVRQ